VVSRRSDRGVSFWTRLAGIVTKALLAATPSEGSSRGWRPSTPRAVDVDTRRRVGG